jgi:2-C-methyl-D-erythritol 2,4-cyclodiphosphate synthase
VRVGIGFDIHRLEAGRPLLLGGVRIPGPRGLVGHSDGDVLFHAMIDALLGASGLGSIGAHFPGTGRWEGADSGSLLARVGGQVREAGFEIGNLDSNILAEEPRLMPYFREMEARAASALGLSPDQVSVKAKTLEGLGAIGRGEAIAAEAVALVQSAA